MAVRPSFYSTKFRVLITAFHSSALNLVYEWQLFDAEHTCFTEREFLIHMDSRDIYFCVERYCNSNNARLHTANHSHDNLLRHLLR